jgi:hypothetical protein
MAEQATGASPTMERVRLRTELHRRGTAAADEGGKGPLCASMKRQLPSEFSRHRAGPRGKIAVPTDPGARAGGREGCRHHGGRSSRGGDCVSVEEETDLPARPSYNSPSHRLRPRWEPKMRHRRRILDLRRRGEGGRRLVVRGGARLRLGASEDREAAHRTFPSPQGTEEVTCSSRKCAAGRAF